MSDKHKSRHTEPKSSLDKSNYLLRINSHIFTYFWFFTHIINSLLHITLSRTSIFFFFFFSRIFEKICTYLKVLILILIFFLLLSFFLFFYIKLRTRYWVVRYSCSQCCSSKLGFLPRETLVFYMSPGVRNWSQRFSFAKTKTQIIFVINVAPFFFATWIVQYSYFLYPKFQAASHLQWLYSLVCVRPGQNPYGWFSHVATQLYVYKSLHHRTTKKMLGTINMKQKQGYSL